MPSNLYNTHIISTLRRIVRTRWALIAAFTILGFIQHLVYDVTDWHVWLLWGVVSCAPILYNAVFEFMLRGRLSEQKVRIISAAQIIVDILFYSLIIHVTGGMTSFGFILYVFVILMAIILFRDIFVIITACATIAAYDLLMILEYIRFLPTSDVFSSQINSAITKECVLMRSFGVSLALLFIGIFAVFINRMIQERSAQLLIEQDTTKSLFQSLIDGVLLVNADHSILLSNPPARELLQIQDGTPVILDMHRYPKEYGTLLTVLRDQTPHKLLDQEVLLDIEGQKTYLAIDSVPVRGIMGDIAYWLKVIHDTTREKHIEEVKSDFISTAAHQLRTPLAALKWFFKMMIDGDAGEVTEEQRRLLKRAYDRNEEVIETVNHLLNVSEIEEGRVHYVFTRTNASKIIREIVEHADRDVEHSHVHVHFVQKSRNIPFIDIDVHKFRIAIQNIVDNAVKYSKAGSDVEVRVSMQDKQYIIEVEDHGIGIPKSEQSRIFMKFFRGGYAKEKETVGSGLGLYIVKNIVTEHRGSIRFASRQGKGTTFTITLPIPSDKKTQQSLTK